MAEETTDTSSRFQLLPEGHYTFTIIGRPEKFATEKSHYRKWIMSYVKPDDDFLHRTSFLIFPWDAEELLLALGGEKTSKGIKWDDEKVNGKFIEADVVHELDNKNVMRQRLRNIKEGIPF